MQKNIIGVDLGATSGRVILARAGDDRLRMEELHRFPNRMREIDGRFYWDIHALYEEILRGLSVAGGRGERIDSIGIDTWGVDFACVDPDGDLLGLPRAYRDPYTDGVPEEFFRTVPRESVYAKTGIQVMNFNSLYQLYALNREHSPALAAAEHVLFMPDALSYLLTGEQVCEYTILSTSQLMNPRTRELDGELLRAAGVDASLFARRVMPGERVGVLRDEVACRTGLGRVEVFAVAGHDTASAIAAVPAAVEKLGAPDKTLVVGNPVRPEVFAQAANREAIRAQLGAGDRTVILSFGGSLGARRVNEVVADLCAWEQHEHKPVLHLHATGQYGVQLFEQLQKQKDFAPGDSLVVKEYINNMPELLAAADLVISRAGALTLAELEAVGRAAVLIPSPNVAENHQYYNAMELQKAGAAVVIEEKDLTGEKLVQTVSAMLAQPGKLAEMGKNARSLSVDDSLDRITAALLKLVKTP